MKRQSDIHRSLSTTGATGERSRSTSRRDRRHRQPRCGAAIVEFAIIANLLFVSVFTCIEFARLNMIRNLVQDAAYAAARHAMVPGATSSEAIAQADLVLSSMISDGYTVQVNNLNEDSEEVSVTINVDLNAVALFAPMFLQDKSIVTTATMRTERYQGFYQQ